MDQKATKPFIPDGLFTSKSYYIIDSKEMLEEFWQISERKKKKHEIST
jgi:hypothetical protein